MPCGVKKSTLKKYSSYENGLHNILTNIAILPKTVFYLYHIISVQVGNRHLSGKYLECYRMPERNRFEKKCFAR